MEKLTMVLPQAFRIVVAVILITQGVGHVMGLLPLAGKKLSETHSADSWLLTPTLGARPARFVGAIIWVLAIALFTLAGMGALGQIVPGQWQNIAAAGSILSLAGLVLFWHAFPFLFPNKVGAILVDVGALIWVFKGFGG